MQETRALSGSVYSCNLFPEKSMNFGNFGSEMHSDVRDPAIRLDNDAVAAPSDRPWSRLLGEVPYWPHTGDNTCTRNPTKAHIQVNPPSSDENSQITSSKTTTRHRNYHLQPHTP